MERKCLSLTLTVALTFMVSSAWAAPVPGGSLDPTTVPKYVNQAAKPATMPKVSNPDTSIDYYEIAETQFQTQILPPVKAPNGKTFPKTTVWGYGPKGQAGTYPSKTIEATVNRPVRVKWINGLVDSKGKFLPHLLPVDQTLHWANPRAWVITARLTAGRLYQYADPSVLTPARCPWWPTCTGPT